MQPENSSVSQLMLALNTYSSNNQVKLATFLPSAAPTGEVSCGAHVFEGFFGLENGPVKSEKPGEDVVWQRFSQTRQDSCRSVSDGVIHLKVPLAGCAGFFLQVSPVES